MSQAGRHCSTPHLPKALPKKTRLLVESAIQRHQAATEALIAFLDEADGDSDLEENGDLEPSLGGQCGFTNYDVEGDDAVLEPDIEADREPPMSPFVLN